jgi:hypothetical protein
MQPKDGQTYWRTMSDALLPLIVSFLPSPSRLPQQLASSPARRAGRAPRLLPRRAFSLPGEISRRRRLTRTAGVSEGQRVASFRSRQEVYAVVVVVSAAVLGRDGRASVQIQDTFRRCSLPYRCDTSLRQASPTPAFSHLPLWSRLSSLARRYRTQCTGAFQVSGASRMAPTIWHHMGAMCTTPHGS